MSLARSALLVLVFLPVASRAEPTSAALTDNDAILLADFTNGTGDKSFDGALQQTLRTVLDESPFLNVLSRAAVAATLKTMALPTDTALTSETARDVCQRAEGKTYVRGAIGKNGKRFATPLPRATTTSFEALQVWSAGLRAGKRE